MGRDVSELFTFDEFLAHWAAERPDRVAMREEDRVYTYAELDDLTARAASALIAAGLKKGDRIAWIGKNSDLYFTLFYGAARSEEHTSELQSLMRISYAVSRFK